MYGCNACTFLRPVADPRWPLFIDNPTFWNKNYTKPASLATAYAGITYAHFTLYFYVSPLKYGIRILHITT